MRSRILLLFCFLLFIVSSAVSSAQNINGEKIQVSSENLTVLKFSGEIKRWELGSRDGFTCQVRGYDNSIVIKTISESPTSTNLIVTEGKRTHYFIIQYLKKVDINNTKLYYDYSDLRKLRQLVASAGDVKDAAEDPAEKKSKKQLKKEAADQEEQDQLAKAAVNKREEAKRLQEQEKTAAASEKQRLKDEKALKAKGEKEAALAREQEKKDALKKQQEEARAKQLAEASEKKRLKEEQERLAQINAIADAKERQHQLDLQKKAEADRLKEQAKVDKRLKDEKASQDKADALARAQRQKEEKAKQDQQAKDLAAAKAKAEADARITNPYWRNPLYRKYPQINFAEPPEGQRITGEYYLPEDSVINYEIATKVLGEKPRLKTAATTNGITLTLQGITFSGVNAYMSFRVKNGSPKDFLVGAMLLKWSRKSGPELNLTACYVTDYPVLVPGAETTLIYVARGINTADEDRLVFTVSNRLNGVISSLPFTGKLYNDEMNR